MFCQIEVVQNGVSIQSRTLRARRHRQDASRSRVGQARVHARDTGRVLHRDRAAHAAAPRETGAARRGAPADRQGEAPGHRRVRLHADRRGGLRLLFQVVTNAYERQNVVYTTNIEFSGWGRVFGDPSMATAIVDRTMHHGRMIRFEGESYRRTHALMG